MPSGPKLKRMPKTEMEALLDAVLALAHRIGALEARCDYIEGKLAGNRRAPAKAKKGTK